MNLDETVNVVLNRTGYSVFLFNKPQGVTLPKIVYQRVVKSPSRYLNGRSLDVDRYQVTVFTRTFAEAKTIADAVITNLDLNQTDFELSYFDSEIDVKDVETSLYQIILDFIIYSNP